RLYCELFMDLPSRKHYPDYYDIIKEPICLNEIKEKIMNCEFETFGQFSEKVMQMFENATIYNDSSSIVHKNALNLQVFINF
ncbi:Bromodomain-containing protein, partial [Rozella allomycis CSF55]